MTEEMSFQVSLENCQGFSIPDGVGSSFHQPGTVNENVPERDFVPLCDGTKLAIVKSITIFFLTNKITKLLTVKLNFKWK